MEQDTSQVIGSVKSTVAPQKTIMGPVWETNGVTDSSQQAPNNGKKATSTIVDKPGIPNSRFHGDIGGQGADVGGSVKGNQGSITSVLVGPSSVAVKTDPHPVTESQWQGIAKVISISTANNNNNVEKSKSVTSMSNSRAVPVKTKAVDFPVSSFSSVNASNRSVPSSKIGPSVPKPGNFEPNLITNPGGQGNQFTAKVSTGHSGNNFSNVRSPMASQRMSPANLQHIWTSDTPHSTSIGGHGTEANIQPNSKAVQIPAQVVPNLQTNLTVSEANKSAKSLDVSSNQLKSYLLSSSHGKTSPIVPSVSPQENANSVDSPMHLSTVMPPQKHRTVSSPKPSQPVQKATKKKKSKSSSKQQQLKSNLLDDDDEDNDFIPVGMVQMTSVRRLPETSGIPDQHQQRLLLQETIQKHLEQQQQQGLLLQQQQGHIIQEHQQPATPGPSERKEPESCSQQHQLLLQLMQQAQQQKLILEQKQRIQQLHQPQEDQQQSQPADVSAFTQAQTHPQRNAGTNDKIQDVRKHQGLIIRHLQPPPLSESSDTQTLTSLPTSAAYTANQVLHDQNNIALNNQHLSSVSSSAPPSSSSSLLLAPLSQSSTFTHTPSQVHIASNKTHAQIPQQYNIPKIAEQILQQTPDQKAIDHTVKQEQTTSKVELYLMQSRQERVMVPQQTPSQQQARASPRPSTPTSAALGHHSHHHPEISRMLCSPVSPRQSASSPRASVSPRRTESPFQPAVSPCQFVSPRQPVSPHSRTASSNAPTAATKSYLTSPVPTIRNNTNQGSTSHKMPPSRQNSSPRPPTSPWQPISPSQVSAPSANSFTSLKKPHPTVGQIIVSTGHEAMSYFDNIGSVASSSPQTNFYFQSYEKIGPEAVHVTHPQQSQPYPANNIGSDTKNSERDSFAGRNTPLTCHNQGSVSRLSGFDTPTSVQFSTLACSPSPPNTGGQVDGPIPTINPRRVIHHLPTQQNISNTGSSPAAQNFSTTSPCPSDSGLRNVPLPSVQTASPIWQQMSQPQQQERTSSRSYSYKDFNPGMSQGDGLYASKPVDIQRLASQLKQPISSASLHPQNRIIERKQDMSLAHSQSGVSVCRPLQSQVGPATGVDTQKSLGCSLGGMGSTATDSQNQSSQMIETTSNIESNSMSSKADTAVDYKCVSKNLSSDRTQAISETCAARQSGAMHTRAQSPKILQQEGSTCAVDKDSSDQTRVAQKESQKSLPSEKNTIEADVQENVTGVSPEEDTTETNTEKDTVEAYPEKDVVEACPEKDASEAGSDKDATETKADTKAVAEIVMEAPKREVRQRKPKKPFEQDDTPSRRNSRLVNQKGSSEVSSGKKLTPKTPPAASHKKLPGRKPNTPNVKNENEQNSSKPQLSKTPSRTGGEARPKKASTKSDEEYSGSEDDSEPESNEPRRLSLRLQVKKEEKKQKQTGSVSGAEEEDSSNQRRSRRIAAKIDYKEENNDSMEEASPLRSARLARNQQKQLKDESGENAGGQPAVTDSSQTGSSDAGEKMATRSRNTRKDTSKDNAPSPTPSAKSDQDAQRSDSLSKAGNTNSRKNITASDSSSNTAGTKKVTAPKSESPVPNTFSDRKMRTRARSKSRSRSPITVATSQENVQPLTRKNLALRQADNGDKDRDIKPKRNQPLESVNEGLPSRKRLKRGDTSIKDIDSESTILDTSKEGTGTYVKPSSAQSETSSQDTSKSLRGRMKKKGATEISSETKSEVGDNVDSKPDTSENAHKAVKNPTDRLNSVETDEQTGLKADSKAENKSFNLPLEQTDKLTDNEKESLTSEDNIKADLTKMKPKTQVPSVSKDSEDIEPKLPLKADTSESVAKASIKGDTTSVKPMGKNGAYDSNVEQLQAGSNKAVPSVSNMQESQHQTDQKQPGMCMYRLVPVHEEDWKSLQGTPPLVPLSGYFVSSAQGSGLRILLPENFELTPPVSQTMNATILKSVVKPPISQTHKVTEQKPQQSVHSHKAPPLQFQPPSTLPPAYPSGMDSITSNAKQMSSPSLPRVQYPSDTFSLRTALTNQHAQASSSMSPSGTWVASHRNSVSPQQSQVLGQYGDREASHMGYRRSHSLSSPVADSGSSTPKHSMLSAAPPPSQSQQPLSSPSVLQQQHSRNLQHLQHPHQQSQMSPAQPPFRPSPSWNPTPPSMPSPSQLPSVPASPSPSWNISSPKSTIHPQLQQQPQTQQVPHSFRTHPQPVPQQSHSYHHQVPQQQQQLHHHRQHPSPQHQMPHYQMSPQQSWVSPQRPLVDEQQQQQWKSPHLRDTSSNAAVDNWSKDFLPAPIPRYDPRPSLGQQKGMEALDSGLSQHTQQMSHPVRQQQSSVYTREQSFSTHQQSDGSASGMYTAPAPLSQLEQQQQEPSDFSDAKAEQIIQNFLRSAASGGGGGGGGNSGGQEMGAFSQHDMALLESKIRLSPNSLISAVAAAYDEEVSGGGGGANDIMSGQESTLTNKSSRGGLGQQDNNSLQDTINLVHTVNLDLEDDVPGVGLDLGGLSASHSSRSSDAMSPCSTGALDNPLAALGGRGRTDSLRDLMADSPPLPLIDVDPDKDGLSIPAAFEDGLAQVAGREQVKEDEPFDPDAKTKPKDRKHQYKIVMDNGVRKFHCLACDKAFSSSTIYRHLRTHDPDYRIKCNMCEKTYTQRSTLIVHMTKSHGYIPKPTPEKKTVEGATTEDSSPAKDDKKVLKPTPTLATKKSATPKSNSQQSKTANSSGKGGSDASKRQRRSSSQSPSNPLNPSLDQEERQIHEITQRQVEEQRRLKAEQKLRKAAGESMTDIASEADVAVNVGSEEENVKDLVKSGEGNTTVQSEELSSMKSCSSASSRLESVSQGQQSTVDKNAGNSQEENLNLPQASNNQGMKLPDADKSSLPVPPTSAGQNSEAISKSDASNAYSSQNQSNSLPASSSAQSSTSQNLDAEQQSAASKLDDLISAVASGEVGGPPSSLPSDENTPKSGVDSKVDDLSDSGKESTTEVENGENVSDADIHSPIIIDDKSGTKKFGCRLCPRVLASKNSFSLHVRRHKEEKTKFCTFCDKAFHTGQELKSHIRTHTGERPYTCEICHHSFSHIGSAMTHKKGHVSRGETEPFPFVNGEVQYPPSFKKPRSNSTERLKDGPGSPKKRKLMKSSSVDQDNSAGTVQPPRRNSLDVNLECTQGIVEGGLISPTRRFSSEDQQQGKSYNSFVASSEVSNIGNKSAGNSVSMMETDRSFQQTTLTSEVDQFKNNSSSSTPGFFSTSPAYHGTHQPINDVTQSSQKRFYSPLSSNTGGVGSFPESYYSPHQQGQTQMYDYQSNVPGSDYLPQHQQHQRNTHRHELSLERKAVNAAGVSGGTNTFKSDSPSTEIVKSLLQHYNLPDTQQTEGGQTAYRQGLVMHPFPEQVQQHQPQQQQQNLPVAFHHNQAPPPQYNTNLSAQQHQFYASPQHQPQQQTQQHHPLPPPPPPPPQYPGTALEMSIEFTSHHQSHQNSQYHSANQYHQQQQFVVQGNAGERVDQAHPQPSQVPPGGISQIQGQALAPSSMVVPNSQPAQNTQPLPKISVLARDANRLLKPE